MKSELKIKRERRVQNRKQDIHKNSTMYLLLNEMLKVLFAKKSMLARAYLCDGKFTKSSLPRPQMIEYTTKSHLLKTNSLTFDAKFS